MPGAALLVVDPERDRLAGRRGAGALLLGAAVAPSVGGEDAVERRTPRRATANGAGSPGAFGGQRAQPEAVDEPVGEQRPTAGANGSVFITSTRCPGRSGLGNAYTSVMSAIGSASARGPEM